MSKHLATSKQDQEVTFSINSVLSPRKQKLLQEPDSMGV